MVVAYGRKGVTLLPTRHDATDCNIKTGTIGEGSKDQTEGGPGKQVTTTA